MPENHARTDFATGPDAAAAPRVGDGRVADLPEESAAVREARLERMILQARDGKSDERAAAAARGPLNKATAQKPPVQKRPRPPRDARKGGEAFEADGMAGCGGPPPEERPRHERRKRRPMGRFLRKLIGVAVLLALLVVAYLIFWPRLREAITPKLDISMPDSLEALLPDETMGYNAVDFSNAILGESREQKELVVMEQDVEVTSQISQDLLNISLFAKQKIIHSFGTGVYTVDLEALDAEDIVFDEASGVIKVTIPHAALAYVSVDVEKTEFEDTRKALLAVGDIKLTAEQKHVLDQSVDAALHERLGDPALLQKADEIALIKARELFAAPVSALSDTLVVKVVMP